MSRDIKLNRYALLGILLCIVLGIMFLPVSATISLRRHQEALGTKRIKTFEFVKADVTLCLSSLRILLVLAVVDLPKTFIMYFFVEKFITSPEDQGRSEAGFMTKNVSFLLIWLIALTVVFFRARLNKNFFWCKKWYATISRVSLFIVIPAAWFLNQFFRMVGIFTQLYSVGNATLLTCATKCYPPLPEADTAEHCCEDYCSPELHKDSSFVNNSYFVQGIITFIIPVVYCICY